MEIISVRYEIHLSLEQSCSVYENKVFQLMSTWIILERFCESTSFSLTEDLQTLFQKEWTLD